MGFDSTSSTIGGIDKLLEIPVASLVDGISLIGRDGVCERDVVRDEQRDDGLEPRD